MKKYYDKYIKSQTSNNPKKYASELAALQPVKDGICADVNAWIKAYYADTSLDLQSVSTRDLKTDLTCVLLDINLYKNPVLVQNAFKLLISNFT